MSTTFKILMTYSGTEIKVRGNERQRVFTLKKHGSTYKMYPMNKQEFEDTQYWTGNDWNQFFKTNEYYPVKH